MWYVFNVNEPYVRLKFGMRLMSATFLRSSQTETEITYISELISSINKAGNCLSNCKNLYLE